MNYFIKKRVIFFALITAYSTSSAMLTVNDPKVEVTVKTPGIEKTAERLENIAKTFERIINSVKPKNFLKKITSYTLTIAGLITTAQGASSVDVQKIKDGGKFSTAQLIVGLSLTAGGVISAYFIQ